MKFSRSLETFPSLLRMLAHTKSQFDPEGQIIHFRSIYPPVPHKHEDPPDVEEKMHFFQPARMNHHFPSPCGPPITGLESSNMIHRNQLPHVWTNRSKPTASPSAPSVPRHPEAARYPSRGTGRLLLFCGSVRFSRAPGRTGLDTNSSRQSSDLSCCF